MSFGSKRCCASLGGVCQSSVAISWLINAVSVLSAPVVLLCLPGFLQHSIPGSCWGEPVCGAELAGQQGFGLGFMDIKPKILSLAGQWPERHPSEVLRWIPRSWGSSWVWQGTSFISFCLLQLLLLCYFLACSVKMNVTTRPNPYGRCLCSTR